MSLHSPHHPLWRLLDRLAMGAVVAGIVWLNSSSFDAGEVKSIALLLAGSYVRDKVIAKHEQAAGE